MNNGDYDTVVITHGGCADGVTSAHMFELFSNSHIFNGVRYYYSYNRDFSKNKDMPDLAGKRVFIVDYSFPIEVLIAIAREATHLYLWDHHETTFNDLFVAEQKSEFDMLETKFSIVVTSENCYVDARAKMTGKYHNMLVQGFGLLYDPSDIKKSTDCKEYSDCKESTDITTQSKEGSDISARKDSGKSIKSQDSTLIIASTGEIITSVCRVSIMCDANMCGAEIAFAELFKLHKDFSICSGSETTRLAISAPWYLKHVRDRDLWLWDRPGYVAGVHYSENSRAFGEVFYEMQIKTSTLQMFDNYTPEQIQKLYARGKELLEHNARIVKAIVAKSERVTFEGYPAMAAQSSILQSDIGNAIVGAKASNQSLAKIGKAPEPTPLIGIIMRYNLTDCCWNVSLRGRVGSPNLAHIAKKYGGGGHPLAAGFDYVGDISQLFSRPDVPKVLLQIRETTTPSIVHEVE